MKKHQAKRAQPAQGAVHGRPGQARAAGTANARRSLTQAALAPAALSDWEQAVAHHQAGRLDDAAGHYEAVLATNPRHADALQLLGLIRLNQGDPARAADLIRSSIGINPASYGA